MITVTKQVAIKEQLEKSNGDIQAVHDMYRRAATEFIMHEGGTDDLVELKIESATQSSVFLQYTYKTQPSVKLFDKHNEVFDKYLNSLYLGE